MVFFMKNRISYNLDFTANLISQSAFDCVINAEYQYEDSANLFWAVLFFCLLICSDFLRLKTRVMYACHENSKVSQKTIRPSFQGLNCKAERPHIAPGKGRLSSLNKQSSDKCMYFG